MILLRVIDCYWTIVDDAKYWVIWVKCDDGTYSDACDNSKLIPWS